MTHSLRFPVTNRDREFAEAMRTNRRPGDLMMLPVDWRADRMPTRALVETKYDGIHAGCPRGRLPFTRAGVDFTAAGHLFDGLEAIHDRLGHRFVLFGEYVHPAGFEGAISDFQRGRGIGTIMLFDAVSVDAYEGRALSPPLWERQAALRCAYDRAGGLATGIGTARGVLFEGEARDNIEIAVGALWEDGLEGAVVKDADSPYVRGPSPYWQRIKRNATVDAPIERAELRPDGKLKALLVRLKNGLLARVGVGFTEKQRETPEQFRAGVIAELKTLGETKNGALRSPSFVRLRHDRTR